MVLGGEPPERGHVGELAGHHDAVLHNYEVVRLTPWRLARDALRHHGTQRSAGPGWLRAPPSACSVGSGTLVQIGHGWSARAITGALGTRSRVPGGATLLDASPCAPRSARCATPGRAPVDVPLEGRDSPAGRHRRHPVRRAGDPAGSRWPVEPGRAAPAA